MINFSLQTSFLAVTVYIEDINDHYPIFQNLPYSVHIEESTPVGTTIYQGISAFDRDKPNTPNSDVQFQFGPESGAFFSLESPHRPSVVLRRQLDFDGGIRTFQLPIIASVCLLFYILLMINILYLYCINLYIISFRIVEHHRIVQTPH